ncbi:PREDICTED: bypass of stop codon protein 1-like [Nicotiana attenuata]|uniref:Pectinesterase inhibitor domain-containing protein n=1 Tax=Nicotiana attenuata TaxID=49451 RepID=A0A314KZ43_NICAT|nr:PREDICTED: bypass of stop codon protein 1-like [Nicotiana attenuata]OIT34512.1 hypothetical protein A4A49_03798 [Nicotiana attenuata]
MAFCTQIFLVFAISFFLTTLPSKAYKNYPTPSPALSPQQSSSSSSSSSSTTASSSVSASASTSASSLSILTASVTSATTFEIPKNIPVVSTGDVSIFVKAIMDATMSKTDEFISKVIDKRLAEPNTDIYAKDCLETCKSVFEDAKDAMKRTEEDVKAGNMYKANVDVSAMSTNIDTCNECATSIYGFDPEFKKFDNWAQGIASDCLDKITGQSS